MDKGGEEGVLEDETGGDLGGMGGFGESRLKKVKRREQARKGLVEGLRNRAATPLSPTAPIQQAPDSESVEMKTLI